MEGSSDAEHRYGRALARPEHQSEGDRMRRVVTALGVAGLLVAASTVPSALALTTQRHPAGTQEAAVVLRPSGVVARETGRPAMAATSARRSSSGAHRHLTATGASKRAGVRPARPAPSARPAAPAPAAPQSAAQPTYETGSSSDLEWGCGAALAYLKAHANPGYSTVCPGYAEGHQAMTCNDLAGLCPGFNEIVIAIPCPAAYENEAWNSWHIVNGPFDPFGSCTDPTE